MSFGCPQLRLRDKRITCHAGPVIGSVDAAFEAAVGIAADGVCRSGKRLRLASEQFLGR